MFLLSVFRIRQPKTRTLDGEGFLDESAGSPTETAYNRMAVLHRDDPAVGLPVLELFQVPR
jgi:hypothetical protein